MKSLVPSAFLFLLALPLLSVAQEATLPTVDELLASDAWGKVPSAIEWAPDGRSIAYLWDDGQGAALWTLTPGGTPTRAHTVAALADPGETLAAFDSFAWLPDGSGWLVGAGGDLFMVPRKGPVKRLTRTAANEDSPRISPRGDRASFVRDHDLWTIDLASGQEARLTVGGKEDETLNGETDWVYWEEIWNRDATASWWSPDGGAIAYYQFDERPVGRYPLLDDAPLDPTVRWQKYPRAGEPNPIVRVGIVDVATKKTLWMETGGDPEAYLARVTWSSDGSWLAVERLDRDQTQLDLLRCERSTGRCAALASERDPHWVNLANDFRSLPFGRYLWSSERDGHRRLELHGPEGQAVAVTPVGWVHESLDAVVGDRVVWTGYSATEPLGAAERHVFRMQLDGTGLVQLTSGRGWHSALVSPATGSWIETASDADTPPTVRLIENAPGGGGKATALPSNPAKLDPARLPRWEFLTIPGPGGSRLPARLIKPAAFDPGKRYPVVVYHYGGPASQVVVDRFGARDAWHRFMAARGYLVFSVDNEASLFFGHAGEVRVHRRFGELELAGQLAGVEYLKSLPYVDPARIGIWGWSGGGSNTLYSLFARPGVWKAGVAGAPVTDWRLYDSIWTERYFDRPQDNPEGYRLSSPITHAANLKDRLLLVHGTADDNVHPHNSWHLMRELQKAKISYEDLTLPGQMHGIRGDGQTHFYRRMTEFFDRELGGGR